MTVELGRYGVWRGATGLSPALASEVEALGYGAIWIGGSPSGDLALAESMLAATEQIAVATGIVNMWTTPAEEVAGVLPPDRGGYPGRFLLGVGIGHPEAVKEYRKPFDTIVDYLDRLDAAKVPVEGRALAALGPKVLALAAERTAGAHPYLTTPEHTREAREILGEGTLLAPEHKVVLDDRPGARPRHRASCRAALPRPAQLRVQPQATGVERRGRGRRRERPADRRSRRPWRRGDAWPPGSPSTSTRAPTTCAHRCCRTPTTRCPPCVSSPSALRRCAEPGRGGLRSRARP